MASSLSLMALRGCAALVLAAMLAAGAQAADASSVVVELFTSQGCAGCRPADLVAADFARRPGVVLLTWPVDYWDYLGWRDTLARPAFAERQRAYAAARGERQVFTPEAIVNGGGSAAGSDRETIGRMIREGAGSASVAVSWAELGDRIVIDVGPAADPATRGEVMLVPILRSRTVSVEGGEKPGRVTHLHVARAIHHIGSWMGRAAHFEVPRSAARAGDADSYMILLQAMPGGRPGRIYGAARGPGL